MKNFILCFLLVAVTPVLSYGATITSTAAGGNWTVGATWVGGVSPAAYDDVIINGPVTQNAGVYVTNLTVNAGCNLLRTGFIIAIYGNFTNNGLVNGNGLLYMRGNGAIISGTGNFAANGDWYIEATGVTVAAGTTISKAGYISIRNNRSLINNGTITLTTETIRLANAVSSFTAGAGSSLQIRKNIAYSAGTGVLDFSAANNSLFLDAQVTQVPLCNANTFHNLTLFGGGTKTLLANVIVNGNFTRNSASTQCNGGGFSITVGGNWTNSTNNSISNFSFVSFNGSGTQTISRTTGNTETFGTVNLDGTGTVTLGDSINLTGSLNINSGTLDVSASNFNIHVDGDFVDGGTFNGRAGTVFMDGTNPQTIDGFSQTNFYNLTINNAAGVSVSFTKEIDNILYVQNGAFGPGGFGSVIISVTNATTYGRIAPLGAGGSLTGGTWQVQTYVNGPATAYWQYCATPTATATLQDWDGDTRFYMSGVGGNDGNACCPVFYSVRTYSEPTNTYTNITTVTTSLTPGRGYMVWMADNLSSLTAPLIYDTRTTPNQGNVNFAVTAGGSGGGYNLVGNPYACPINFSTVVTTSGNLFANFLVLQENGTYATSPNGGVIPPGQGFLCAATSSGNIQFTESAKNTSSTPSVIRAVPENQIKIKAGNDVNGLGEEVVIQLDNTASEAIESEYDLLYIPSPYETATHIWTSNSGNDKFILNRTSSNDDHITIPFSVVSSTIGVQSLTFKDLNSVTAYNCAWLEDTENGQRINLNMNDTYSFEEEALGVEHKFILHLERTNDCEMDLQRVDPSLDAQTSVYVNSGNVYAQFGFAEESMVTISMFDMSGRAVMGETNMSVSNQTVPLTAPDAHGIYIVRIVKNGEAVSKKFYY